MTRIWCFLAMGAAMIVAGCDAASSQRKKMEGSGAPPSWPALQAFRDPGGFDTVGMGMDREGPAAGKKAAADPTFKKLLGDFEKEPIPTKFATSARETAKKALVESLRKLPDASDNDAKELGKKATESMTTLITP